ncbi:MAG: SH3 domain-containing C40 family peptidase [Lachnospiraceae bacterium]|nr:SH3 domain-containing C40 family peptidase [Lachnospiraceae bacterium]
MKNRIRKFTSYALATGLLLTTLGFQSSGAKEVLYTESDVSITSAVDRYIENGSIGVMQKKDLTIGNAFAISETFRQDTETAPQVELGEGAVLPMGLDFADKALVVAQSTVNIREQGDVSAKRVGSICRHGLVTVKEKGDTWSLIVSGACEGYIKNEFLLFGSDAEAYAKANLPLMIEATVASLRVREAADESSKCLTQIAQGACYEIIQVGSEWTEIQVDNSLSGFVNNNYIQLTYQTYSAIVVSDTPEVQTPADNNTGTTQTPASEGTTEATTEASTTQAPVQVPTSSTGVDIANYAMQFEGNPYVYGGTSLTDGADCSGFTMSVYAAFGISIPRTADVQPNAGTEVSLSDVYPGDLIFYAGSSGSINHVALYIGGGQVIHASTPSTGIIIANMYYRTPCKAVRVVTN